MVGRLTGASRLLQQEDGNLCCFLPKIQPGAWNKELRASLVEFLFRNLGLFHFSADVFFPERRDCTIGRPA